MGPVPLPAGLPSAGRGLPGPGRTSGRLSGMSDGAHDEYSGPGGSPRGPGDGGSRSAGIVVGVVVVVALIVGGAFLLVRHQSSTSAPVPRRRPVRRPSTDGDPDGHGDLVGRSRGAPGALPGERARASVATDGAAAGTGYYALLFRTPAPPVLGQRRPSCREDRERDDGAARGDTARRQHAAMYPVGGAGPVAPGARAGIISAGPTTRQLPDRGDDVRHPQGRPRRRPGREHALPAGARARQLPRRRERDRTVIAPPERRRRRPADRLAAMCGIVGYVGGPTVAQPWSGHGGPGPARVPRLRLRRRRVRHRRRHRRRSSGPASSRTSVRALEARTARAVPDRDRAYPVGHPRRADRRQRPPAPRRPRGQARAHPQRHHRELPRPQEGAARRGGRLLQRHRHRGRRQARRPGVRPDRRPHHGDAGAVARLDGAFTLLAIHADAPASSSAPGATARSSSASATARASSAATSRHSSGTPGRPSSSARTRSSRSPPTVPGSSASTARRPRARPSR